MAILKISVEQSVYDYFHSQSTFSKMHKSEILNDLLRRYIAGEPLEQSIDNTIKQMR